MKKTVFSEFGDMIKCLVIGNSVEVQKYVSVIGQSKYFDFVDGLIVSGEDNNLHSGAEKYDAIFFVSQIASPVEKMANAIKAQKSIYLTDQISLTEASLMELGKLHREANNLIFIEKLELEHPLVDDFLVKSKGHFQLRYSKTIPSIELMPQSLFSALCFLMALSSVQVKEIEVKPNKLNVEKEEEFVIRLKMYDRSVSQISLKLGVGNEHSLWIDSKAGQFTFNFSENYLENIHGKKFKTLGATPNELLQKSVGSFGLCIILNKPPSFSFNDYMQVLAIIKRIEAILRSSF